MARILVTGAAGFIGYHLSQRLLERGDEVVGYDNLNAYYDPALKQDRLTLLREHAAFTFLKGDLADRPAMEHLFATHAFNAVAHLAAQAGVRYSITNPYAYAESNLVGFLNVLEGCRNHPPRHLVYASSSSVYGANRKIPFSVEDPANHPVSLYAATKRANELMAHVYGHLYALPVTGLRFFTVYGPWGRPDMAYFSFAKAIMEGRPIDVYNHGQMRRDLTYVDDVVEGVVRVMDRPALPDPTWDAMAPATGSSSAPHRVYNIGNHTPVELMHLIAVLEDALGRKAQLRMKEMQPGDVLETYADVEGLEHDVGFAPSTPIEEGIRRFADWFLTYRPGSPISDPPASEAMLMPALFQ